MSNEIVISSFSYRTKTLNNEAVFDCRGIRNPHKLSKFRDLDGTNNGVLKYVAGDPKAGLIVLRAIKLVDSGQCEIGFGCVGGRHRSVAVAEITAANLRTKGYNVKTVHENLKKE